MTLVFNSSVSAIPVPTTTAVVISDFIQNNELSSTNSIYITWNVNVSSVFTVKYRVLGSIGAYTDLPANGVSATSHEATLIDGLVPGTSYEVVITTGTDTDTLNAVTDSSSDEQTDTVFYIVRPLSTDTVENNAFDVTIFCNNDLIKFDYHVRQDDYPVGSYDPNPYNRTGTTGSKTISFEIPSDWTQGKVRVYRTRDDGTWGAPGSNYTQGRYVDVNFVVDIQSTTVPKTVDVPTVTITSPTNGEVLTGTELITSWTYPNPELYPNLAFDNHISRIPHPVDSYVDASNLIHDTNGLGLATDDSSQPAFIPANGQTLYGRLSFPNRDPVTGIYDSVADRFINGQYVDYTFQAQAAPPVTGNEDSIAIKESVDGMLSSFNTWFVYRNSILDSEQGYHSAAAMRGFAQMFKTYNENTYMDYAVLLGRKWIDSGRQLDGDGYLDWRYNAVDEINKEHHEWRAAAGIADILIEIKRSGYESISGTEDKFHDFLRDHVWDKWDHGHNIQGPSFIRSSNATRANDFVGRWALIAMALDQYHATTGNNVYASYINEGNKPFGIYFDTQVSLGTARIPGQTNDSRGPTDRADISHAGDLMYAVMRAKQLGYNPRGKMDQVLAVYENILNNSIFKTSAGFTEYSDGTGSVDQAIKSAAHGHALSAALSTTLRDRWVDYYRNNSPYFNHSPDRRFWMAGGLCWALAGGTL